MNKKSIYLLAKINFNALKILSITMLNAGSNQRSANSDFLRAMQRPVLSSDAYQGWPGDDELARQAVWNDARQLPFTSQSLREDKEFVLMVVAENSLALQLTSAFQGDKDVALAALRQNENAFSRVSPVLQRDAHFITLAIQANPWVCSYVDKELLSKEMALSAVTRDELVIQGLPQFHDDREIMFEAVIQNYQALFYASQHLRNDSGFILNVFSACTEKKGSLLPRLVLRYLGPALKNDKGFMERVNMYVKDEDADKANRGLVLTRVSKGKK